ncbi:MAG: FtsX-like permease family protein, partial [Gemmatimonadaceae bacterium]
WVGVQLLRSVRMGASIPRLAEVHVDGVTILMTVVVAAVATLIVSLVPFLRVRRTSLSAALSANAPSASGGATRSRTRRTLVTAQVALALVLLAAAGLLARSAGRLRSVDPGFDAPHAIAFRVALPNATYPAAGDAARLIVNALDAIAALPGVQAAGVVTKLPLDLESRQDSAVWVEDRPVEMGEMVNIHPMLFVSPGYFRAIGIPLVAGRLFGAIDPAVDPAQRPRELIVSQAFADRYWKGEDPIGRRIRMHPQDPWSTIVGVVGSVHEESLEQPPGESVYIPLLVTSAAGTPFTPHDIAFVVRSAGDAASLAAPIDRAVRGLAPALPLYRVMPVTDLLSQAVARTTFTLLLVGVAAAVATAIGAMGIYGVISYMVSLRTREISVRRALGASQSDVLRLVTRHTLTDATIGIGLGLLGAVALKRLLAPVLFGVTPQDPVALGGAAALLLLTAVIASWIPARRAATVDPAGALRLE